MDEEKKVATPKNTATIEDSGPCKKKVIVEIPAGAVKTATDEQYETLRKETVVPGFRKGRAPRRLLEKRFGKETSEQIKLKLLADASDAALKDNELDVLRDPDIDFEKIELPAEGPLKFDFEVEVKPQFELPTLEGIAVNKTKLEVTDEQIDREVEQLRKYSGLWTPRADGAVEPDDQIIADAVLSQEEEEEKLDNIEIFVRPQGFVGAIPVENLDELLVGAKSGDVKKTTVEVPKTYFREEYRGKKYDISITVNDIKYLKPAELNEDFFNRVDIEDEKELREKIGDNLNGRLEQQSKTEMTSQIHEYLLKNTKFDLPTDVVADQATTLLQRQYTNLIRQGLSREQLEEQTSQLQASSEQQAEEQLKTFFIMDKIAEKLAVEVNEEEVNGHIARLAIQQGQRPEKIREQMARDGSLSQFSLQIREDKCITKLLESAKITEVKPKKTAKKKKQKAVKKAPVTEKKAKTVKKTAKKADTTPKKQPKKRKTSAKKKTDD